MSAMQASRLARKVAERIDRPTIVLAAGGTGGHMFPAHALDQELCRRGLNTHLVTDRRGLGYPGLFPDTETTTLTSRSMAGGVAARLAGGWSLLQATRQARALLRRLRPALVIGFGGYPALPALLAARSLGIAYCMHEQNAVLGRVNRLMAGRASALALSYARTARLRGNAPRVITGNPVRDDIRNLAETPLPAIDAQGSIRLLVVGGSQGARVLSDVVPDALSLLPAGIRAQLQVLQQARPEDTDRVAAAFQQMGIAAEVLSFVEDLPARLADSHLVIARAGASTLAELAVIGRPAVLVPLAIATDDHQTANARALADAGAATVVAEGGFTPPALAKALQHYLARPDRLQAAARAAASIGQRDAAAKLADMVIAIAEGRSLSAVGASADGQSDGPDTMRRVSACA